MLPRKPDQRIVEINKIIDDALAKETKNKETSIFELESQFFIRKLRKLIESKMNDETFDNKQFKQLLVTRAKLFGAEYTRFFNERLAFIQAR